MKRWYKIFLGLICVVSLLGCGAKDEAEEIVVMPQMEEIPEVKTFEEISEEVIPEEDEQMATAEYQQLMAEGIANGIDRYFEE